MTEFDHFATLAPPSAATAARLGDNGKSNFEQAIEALQIQAANFGAHMALDAEVRRAYARHIAATASDLRMQASTGSLTWARAAEQANVLRNAIMDDMRGRSSPVGKAIAEALKRDGKTLNTLIAEKTIGLYGRHADFHALSAAQRDAVYAAIVESSGTSRPAVTLRMQQLCYAGRALLVATVAISVYNIATAQDKGRATLKEGSVLGASIAGGMAAGALAGLACGPGAPVCVSLGAFVGGTLAGLGVGALW